MGCLGPILAIDTSTDQAGVAVYGDGIAISLSWQAGRTQTVSVLDQIDRCLTLAGSQPDGIGVIAVANGPGMFTSLRVGVSLAKGLASGLDLPVIGVSTLRIAAHPWFGFDREVVAAVAVGRGRTVWQRFSADGLEIGPPVNGSYDELRSAVNSTADTLAVGELAPLESSGPEFRSTRRDPLVFAQLARERFDRSGGDDLILLQPDYVHTRSGAIAGT